MGIVFESKDLKIVAEDSSTGEECRDYQLRNFETGSSELRPLHRTAIADDLAPFLSAPNTIGAIYGLASRLGSADRNKELSGQRMASVAAELQKQGVPTEKFVFDIDFDFFGEDFDEEHKVADGNNDSEARAVIVYIWPDLATSQVVFKDKPIRSFALQHKTKPF